jgi:DNA-binding IclR family transcriptional regulator
MSGAAAYENEAQQRLLRLVMLLAGHEITGLAPAEIARQQECMPPMVTRDLANLALAGWAEQVPETGRWRLAPPVVQVAMRHMVALDRAKDRLAEVQARYSRQAA